MKFWEKRFEANEIVCVCMCIGAVTLLVYTAYIAFLWDKRKKMASTIQTLTESKVSLHINSPI